jgi:hypothetical protein
MVTLTSNYKQFLQPETVEKIEKLIEDSYDYVLEDILDFIDTHSESDFMTYYEEYYDKVEEFGMDVVEDFISEFGIGIDSLSSIGESYRGNYGSAGDFAESNCEEMGYDIPDFIVVDWEETFRRNLCYDFVYTESNGNVFYTNW